MGSEGGGAVVSVSGVSKRYRPPGARWRRARDRWALRDVDLELQPGETLGILGHNGAGKTTLLRLLAGVTQPTAGRVRVEGRITPLISVGVGFHQELSGRENVYLNGQLLGLTKQEVDERYDAVIEFSELVDVLDTPVKFYSSGMLMRLAFSVAVHARTDVLLVDEVLAVGDLAFQLKCFERMREMQRAGTTVVLVSHSLHAIRLLCGRVLVLDHGRPAFDGRPDEAVTAYLDLLVPPDDDGVGGTDPDAALVFTSRALVDAAGGPAGELAYGEHYCLAYRLRATTRVVRPMVTVRLLGETGSVAYELSGTIGPPEGYGPGDDIALDIPFTALMGGGSYRLVVTVVAADGTTVLGEERGRTVLYLAPQPGTYGVAQLDARIEVAGRLLSDHSAARLDGAAG